MTGVVEVIGAGLASAWSAAAPAAAGVAASPWVTGALALGQAGMSIASAQQQAVGLRAQAQAANASAAQADFAAGQEELRGRAAALGVRQALAQTLAAQNARYAAAGVALDGGTPETVADATTAEADRQLAIGGANAVIRAEDQWLRGGQLRQQARLLGDRADSTMTAGWLGAGGSLFDLFDRTGARLPGTVRRTAAAAAS
jgi:hypothetical protein